MLGLGHLYVNVDLPGKHAQENVTQDEPLIVLEFKKLKILRSGDHATEHPGMCPSFVPLLEGPQPSGAGEVAPHTG